ncbi:MAG: hypothetical protein DMG23_00995 [Acidobacteria bacterium]|nr:MAG: hypothetical protein DMG23_00995 [Acidobacteriota bacterium]
MKKSLLPVLILIVMTTPVAIFGDEWTKKFALTGKAELRVETDDGDVRVTVGSGPAIEAQVHTAGWRISPDEVRVTDRQSGNRVEIEVKIPKQHWNGGHRSVRIELTVPRETDSEIRTGDGNVSIEDVKGGTCLSTGDGNVEARSLEGTFEATTGDGNIRVAGRFDQLNLKTGDGEIAAEVGPGSKMGSEWSVRTGDGNVALRLSKDFSAELDAHTGDGDIDLNFPITVAGSLKGSSIRGKINGGGPTLTVRTGDGSIRLEQF